MRTANNWCPSNSMTPSTQRSSVSQERQVWLKVWLCCKSAGKAVAATPITPSTLSDRAFEASSAAAWFTLSNLAWRDGHSQNILHFLPWQSHDSLFRARRSMFDFLSAKAAHNVRLSVVKQVIQASKGTQHQHSVALPHNWKDESWSGYVCMQKSTPDDFTGTQSFPQ